MNVPPPMDHDEAVRSMATERYLGEEMDESERDAFEAHYFDCAVCAEDVKAAYALHDRARHVAREDRWRRHVAVMAVVGGVLAYWIITLTILWALLR